MPSPSIPGSNEYCGLVDEAFRLLKSVERWNYLRRFIWERDHGTCGICHQQVAFGPAMHLDHILRSRENGPTHHENLRATHASCNRQRPKSSVPLATLAQLLAAPRPNRRRIEQAMRREVIERQEAGLEIPGFLERALRDLARERSSTTPAAEETAR